MTPKPLYRSLDENLAFLEEMFGRSDDFYTKHLMIAGIRCAIVMFTGLSSPENETLSISSSINFHFP